MSWDSDKAVELQELAEQWKEQFGEQLPIGWPVGTDDIPAIRRGLEENDPVPFRAELDAALARIRAEGRVW